MYLLMARSVRYKNQKIIKDETKSYYGKKKQTTRKVILIYDEIRRIGFLFVSKSGRRHDKRLLDKSGVMLVFSE
jgi:DDE superfamily endonuclease